jgi:hypothetical protein
MFLSAINWRHIVGALVTGIILQIAGVLDFWHFLGLVAIAITIALAQYMPVAKRTATAILLIGGLAAIGIPTIHGFIAHQWPATSESLQKQGVAADLKGKEIFNQPGIIGIADQQKLADKKEQNFTALAQQKFDEAAQLNKNGQFVKASQAEQLGRDYLNRAIKTREADSSYIREKLSTVKMPTGWWSSVKNWFAGLDFGALGGILQKGFALRLLVLGAVLLVLGLLLFKWFPKSKLIGLIAVLGGVAILWSLFLIFTPEITPAPGASGPKAAIASGPQQMTTHGNTVCVTLQPGQWSAPVYEPRGAAHKYFFRGPKGTLVQFGDGVKGLITDNYRSPAPLRFFNPTTAGEVVVIFQRL